MRIRAFGLLAVFALAACAGAAAPSPTPGVVPTPRATPTPVPGASDLPASGGGGSDQDTGTFPDPNSCCDGGLIGNLFPDGPNGNPLFGAANYLTPAKGLLNPRQVNVQLVRAAIDNDGSALVDLRWWSGVAPCNQLDRVQVVKDDGAMTIRLVVWEGSGGGDVMCIEIAELHATLIDLGALASGKWTIFADGDAPAIPLDVP